MEPQLNSGTIKLMIKTSKYLGLEIKIPNQGLAIHPTQLARRTDLKEEVNPWEEPLDLATTNPVIPRSHPLNNSSARATEQTSQEE